MSDVQYRYCIIPPTGSGIFEREPNRVISLMPGLRRSDRAAYASLAIPELRDEGFRQREWQTYDGNFVPPNLSYNDVPPCLAIGPYPQSKEDVELMKRNGVTGVLNVQTDFDHERRMIDWQHMQEYYHAADLQVTRVPIEDFNGDELVRLVKEGARAVDRMYRDAEARGEKPKIYIHCTAGMGRAPAVACVYLVWKHGYSLHDALKQCKDHRPVCAPNWHAMESALRSGF